MTPTPVNIHATAIVIGESGIVFAGPSGSGKSLTALTCMAAARRQGLFSALVADDRVLVSREGDRLIASCPAPIAGLIEIRGSGITRIESVPSATLHLAVSLVSLPEAERLPPENEVFSIPGAGTLPLLRIWRNAPDPLAVLAAFAPRFGLEIPF